MKKLFIIYLSAITVAGCRNYNKECIVHNDWNNLIEAVRRLKEKGHNVLVAVDDIFYTWKLVSQNCH